MTVTPSSWYSRQYARQTVIRTIDFSQACWVIDIYKAREKKLAFIWRCEVIHFELTPFGLMISRVRFSEVDGCIAKNE